MTPHTPPPVLERLLGLLLADRDRQTISGDLHEAYTETALRRGRFPASVWYLRQVLSFAPHRPSGTRAILAAVCVFSALSGAWLGTMDLILQHAGYGRRELIAATIVTQALLTLAIILLPRATKLRPLVLLGCLPLLGLVAMVVSAVLHGADVEGYVLLIALTLALQTVLTTLMLLPRQRPLA